MGDKLVGAKAALQVWRDLLHNPFFITAVVESNPPIRGYRSIGFGASVFVSSQFVDKELAGPRPDINSRIIASITSGQSVLLRRREIASANAGAGVDIVILYGSWREHLLGQKQNHDVQTLLPASFIELHAGYKIRRILWETASANEHRFARSSGVYQLVAEFAEAGRMLNISTGQGASMVPASLANVLFRYTEPLLRLREADQELLIAAQMGATDDELGTTLGLTLSAVKARWRSIFIRISEVKPDLAADAGKGEGRGPQKRHRVLAYIRKHPEELRP